MKILTISNCPTRESLGSGYVIVNFCKQLRLLGHEVFLFQPDDYEFARFLRPRMNSYRITFGMFLFVFQQMQKNTFDMVEFYGGQSWLSIFFLRIFFPRLLVVHHTNGPEMKYLKEIEKYEPLKWYQLNQNSFFNISFQKAKGVVTVSKQDYDWLIENNIQKADRVVSIHPGLSNEYLGLSPDNLRAKKFGYCGTWLPKKGIEMIMNDLPKILNKHLDAVFYLVGVGDSFRKENHFPVELLDRIVVIPFIENKETLKKYYCEWRVFILPSKVESFGLVMAEAMACGCALVTTNVGFARELVHMKEALIIKESDGELANGVNFFFDNNDVMKRISEEGMRRVQRLTWENAGKLLSDKYLFWNNYLKNA